MSNFISMSVTAHTSSLEFTVSFKCATKHYIIIFYSKIVAYTLSLLASAVRLPKSFAYINLIYFVICTFTVHIT